MKIWKNLLKLSVIPLLILTTTILFPNQQWLNCGYLILLWGFIAFNHLEFIAESNENVETFVKINDNINILDKNVKILKNEVDKLKIIVDKNGKTKEKNNVQRNKTTRTV